MSPFTFRKDFRPAYTKLNLLGTCMPHTPILAMTATATAHNRNEIKRSLGMQNVLNVEANVDRENIFYEVHPRGNRGDEKLITIIEPLALECYSYFEQELGPHQFYPAGSPSIFSNRLFAQYHAQTLKSTVIV